MCSPFDPGFRMANQESAVKRYPETIDNAWDVLYRDYPDVYEAFASFPYHPPVTAILQSEFNLAGKVVLDVGAGTGQSARGLARSAARVIGVEPEAAMRAIGMATIREHGPRNVEFVAGTADALPVADASVDVVTAVTAPFDLDEALRVLRAPGLLISVEIAPGWYGGELSAIINHPTPELADADQRLTRELGFAYRDVENVQDYGTTDNILRTYGFIFGPNAIAHLKQTRQTTIRWRWRFYSRHRSADFSAP